MQSDVGRDRRIPPFHRTRRGPATPPYNAAPDSPWIGARESPRLHDFGRTFDPASVVTSGTCARRRHRLGSHHADPLD